MFEIEDINRVIEGESIDLHNPRLSELWYREKLYRDEKTMAFAENCKHEIDQWPPKDTQELKEWFIDNNSNMSNFYSYIIHKESRVPIGEVAIYYHTEFNKYMIHIIVEDRYRHRGFGTEAVSLLLEHVFKVMNLDAIYEIREPNRVEVKNLFRKLGFVISEDDEELLWLTKREYNARR